MVTNKTPLVRRFQWSSTRHSAIVVRLLGCLWHASCYHPFKSTVLATHFSLFLTPALGNEIMLTWHYNTVDSFQHFNKWDALCFHMKRFVKLLSSSCSISALTHLRPWNVRSFIKHSYCSPKSPIFYKCQITISFVNFQFTTMTTQTSGSVRLPPTRLSPLSENSFLFHVFTLHHSLIDLHRTLHNASATSFSDAELMKNQPQHSTSQVHGSRWGSTLDNPTPMPNTARCPTARRWAQRWLAQQGTWLAVVALIGWVPQKPFHTPSQGTLTYGTNVQNSEWQYYKPCCRVIIITKENT